MSKVGLFSEGTARAIVSHVRKYGKKTPALNRRQNGQDATARRTIWFKAPAGGIPAASGNVLGEAECEVLRRNTDTNELEPSGEAVTVYNWVDAVVADKGKRWGVAHYEMHGDWMISAADCTQE